MTIAIGYHCYRGVIVAADTLIVCGVDKKEGTKLHRFWVSSGSFGFVYSSEDAHAAITLINEIHRELHTASLPYYSDLEEFLKLRMASWCQGFGGQTVPQTQLILGVMLRKSDKPRLYLCEPPNTVVLYDDYVACGLGSAVTDPLYETLFSAYGGEYAEVQLVLRRIAYLAHKAKNGNIYCGKNTDAAIVCRGDIEPESVMRLDMEKAEQISSHVDILLSEAAIILLSGEKASMNAKVDQLAELLKAETAGETQFRNDYGDVIKIEDIKQSASEK